MFDAYFCPRVVARLRAGPQPILLQTFLERLHRRGHTRCVIQYYLRAAEVFVLWLHSQRRPLSGITQASVRAFANRQRPGRSPQATVHAALRQLLCHLRQQEIVPSPAEATTERERTVTAYDTHLQEVAGLAPATRLYRRRYAREFLTMVFGTAPIHWDRLRPKHLHAFIDGYGQAGCAAAARVAAHSLRDFLRWLQLHGHVDASLPCAIPTFRLWRHTALPQPLTDEHYRALLASFDQEKPVGRRDFAIAVCMGDLGLRCAEVAGLTLADLDETALTLRIATSKSRRGRILPLPTRAQQAVLAYVHRDRPDSRDEHLFLRHRTPRALGISRELVRGIVRRAFAQVLGCEQQTGTHVLRHTAATRLHRAGADIKRIADILGHRCIDTTVLYAKVDRDRLSTVALPWPVPEEVRS